MTINLKMCSNSPGASPDRTPMQCWDFGDGGGVLELGRPGLELHWRLLNGRTLAWWCDDRGRWLRLAQVGVA